MTPTTNGAPRPTHAVLVSRRWASATITVHVTNEAVGIAMPLADFLAALVAEAGNPTRLLTQAQLLKRLSDASDVVVRSMKQETARVL